MAALLEDSDLLVRLSGGDLASNEVYYHDHCYFRFSNRYNRKIKHNQDATSDSVIGIIERSNIIKMLLQIQ